MNTIHRSAVIVAVSVALLAAVGVGYWWGRSRDDASNSVSSSTQSAERKALYWYDPMVPDQHFEKPGKSPFMDMQLVPKYADETTEGGISIAPGVRQNLGVHTVVVERGHLAAAVHVPGSIGWDLRQERIVSARVDSIVERLHVRAPFEPVRAGQPLASVIAPTWSTALAEARALGEARSASARALQSAAHERLRALGLPAGVSGGGGGRITLTSPVTGIVSEIGVREGQSAPTGTLLFRVNGTRTVWLEAAIPQASIAGIAAGTPVEVGVDARPGETFHGRVESVLPQIDMGSRTQRARIVLDNSDGVLAPGMFAQITLQPVAGAERPLVPTDALIGAGAKARVIVLGADDKFRPVIVRTGRSGGGMTEVLTGLTGGERIVASGQFLIDSEANLSGALERLGAAPEEPSTSSFPRGRGFQQPNGWSSKDFESSEIKETDVRASRTNSEKTMSPDGRLRRDENRTGMRGNGEPKAKSMDDRRTPLKGTSRLRGDDEQKQTPASVGRSCPVQYWYDPMVPDQHFDQPDKSPFMDMQLVPKFAPDADPDCTIRELEGVTPAEPQP
jgi:Cu(I)/Ag(I) efflux system membrane fusion protein